MKRMRFVFPLLVVCCLMLALFAGCENKEQASGDTPSIQGDYSRGIWEENTYKSEYLGLTFPLPEGYKVVGDREILRLMSLDRREFANKEEQDQAVGGVALIFDFIIGDETNESGMPMVQLMAENLKANREEAMEAMEYAQKLSENLLTQENNPNGYVVDQPAEYSLAGGDWVILTTQMEKKELSQWYVMQRKGDYLISFVCTFPPAEQSEVESFLSSVQSL